MKKRIISFAVIFAICISLFVPCSTVSAASATKTEKSKITSILKKNCYDYFSYCVLYDLKSLKLTDQRKTDMALHALSEGSDYIPLNLINSESTYNKYHPYGGIFKLTGSLKKKITAKGKSMFGKSFKVKFKVRKKNENLRFYLYPKTYDKKYIEMDAGDWGDWGTQFKVTSVTKSKGVYTATCRIKSGWEGNYDTTTYFKVKLKKSGSSYVIKSVTIK